MLKIKQNYYGDDILIIINNKIEIHTLCTKNFFVVNKTKEKEKKLKKKMVET